MINFITTFVLRRKNHFVLPNFLPFASEFSHLCFRIFSPLLPNFLTFCFRIFSPLLPNFLTFTSEFSHLCFRIFSRNVPNSLTFSAFKQLKKNELRSPQNKFKQTFTNTQSVFVVSLKIFCSCLFFCLSYPHCAAPL
jgi:hypothetical protein